ncbi:MAG: hypothetical protein CM1200mP41_05940 [Gammaproteobacteria bacterium]|nr:MAG: hypothetical protein CM1200mP41_05940 [Gammaproteobacteria bacterium]
MARLGTSWKSQRFVENAAGDAVAVFYDPGLWEIVDWEIVGHLKNSMNVGGSTALEVLTISQPVRRHWLRDKDGSIQWTKPCPGNSTAV